MEIGPALCYNETKEGDTMAHTHLPHDHGAQFAPESIPSGLQFQVVADTCKQLADPTRLKLFWILCHCRECVINVSAMMEMSSPAVSHHLRQLRQAGLIESTREGKEVYYQAAQTPQARLLHDLIEQVMEISCPNI